MKTILLSTFLSLSLILSSCSTYDWKFSERKLASETEAPLNAEELFSIKSTSNTQSGKNFIKELKSNLSFRGVEIEFIEDSKMSSEEAFKLNPTVENQTYKLKIFHSKNAASDFDAVAELSRFINQFMEKKVVSHFSIFELYYNAKAGDFTSLQVIAKMRASALETGANSLFSEGDFTSRSAEKVSYWNEVQEKFESSERIYNKNVKIKENARRAVMDALDKASDDEQLRSLVAKNNREGAAELLRKYLPWELMPPFEKMFWETHLSVMTNPLPLEDRVLIYRGINDDIVQVAQESGKELSREEAIREQKIFLLSTMMTKNQGTWNRRLRSLTAMYEKFMGTDYNNSSEFTRGARITTMFVKHSKEPKGSPFLSYTPKFNVASGFGSKRNTAYFIDPRIIYFNYASKFSHEIEFLLPIMSFPDELAAVWDHEIFPEGNSNVEKFLKEKAIAKLEKELGSGKGVATYDRIELNSKKFFAPVLGGKTGAVASPKPDGKFVSFFKKIFGMSTSKAAEVITEKSDMACVDLIQLFWN